MKNRNAKFLTLIAASIASATVFTGCIGNDARTSSQRQSQLRHITEAGGGSGGGLQNEFRCSGVANVLPHYDYRLNGTMEFEACAHQGVNSKVLILAEALPDREICVLPAQYLSDERVMVKPGADLLPIYQCGTPREIGLMLDFPAVNYNAVIVVERADLAAIRSCMGSGYAAGCPQHWSWGRFRQ